MFERLRQADSTISLLTWTLVGTALQLTLTIASMIAASESVGFPFPFPYLYDPSLTQTDMRILAGVYIALPIVYTIPVSLYVFKPKRIVSPQNIQLLTIAVFGMILLARTPFPQYMTPFGYAFYGAIFGVMWILAFLVYGILGVFQTLFVRWWIGLNPEDLAAETYSIGLDFRDVRKLLLSRAFLNTRILQKKVDEPSFLLLKRRIGENGVIIGLGGDSRECVLAIFPFTKGLYALSPSESSSDLRASIVNEIKGMLPKGTKVAPRKHPTDIVTSKTRDFAFEPTRTKFEVTRDIWQRIPRYYRYAFVATIAALVLVSMIYFEQSTLRVSVDSSMYLELVVLLFVALVIELGGAAWQDFSERRRPKARTSG